MVTVAVLLVLAMVLGGILFKGMQLISGSKDSKQEMSDSVWILHGHDTAKCGCSATYSIYSEVDKWVDGRVRLDSNLCERHEIKE